MSRQIEALATQIFNRLQEKLNNKRAPQVIAIIYDDDDTIRMLPSNGRRIKVIEEDFPGSIIGYYDRNISQEHFVDDILAYFRTMGAVFEQPYAGSY